MRNIICCLFALVVFAGCGQKKDSGNIDASVVENTTRIKFERDVIDFKRVQAGERVTGSFRFTNAGSNDLVIYEVSTSCGCTVVDYPRSAIAPGESSTISLTYDSDGASGMRISKEVVVLANTEPSKTKLRIVADVY